MAYPWQYGLVNYWLGIALALHAAAFWISRRPREGGDPAFPSRSVKGSWIDLSATSFPAFAGMTGLGLLSLFLWTAHVFGWAVFAVLVWSHAVTQGHWRRLAPETLKLWPLAAPAIVMLVLAYGQAGGQAETLGWFEWSSKFDALRWTLRDQWQWFDLASLAAAGMLILWGLIERRRFALNGPLVLASGVMLAAIAIVPRQLLGSAFADGRMWPVAIMLALIAMRPGVPMSWLAVGAAGLFALRTAVTLSGFLAYDATYARHLRALDAIPQGSRVAVFTRFPCERQVPWRRQRLDHLDGLALVRRDAFTNGQWDVPGAQLLTPLAAKGTWFNSDPSQLVRSRDCPADLRAALAWRIAAFPRDRYDQVWVMGFAPATLPHWPGLTPVFADDETILYRIAR